MAPDESRAQIEEDNPDLEEWMEIFREKLERKEWRRQEKMRSKGKSI